MKQGILIIACGHPYYGKMAAALAATLRASDETLQIHLAYAGDGMKHMSSDEVQLFSSHSEIPPEYYMGTKWIRTKMFMYDLSPYDETLYLDSDVLWLKKSPADIFNTLADVDLTFPNFGYFEYANDEFERNAWVNIQSVKEAYDFNEGEFYDLHSEMAYFKKSEVAEKYFETAKEVYDNMKVDATVFAGLIPDELAFSITCTLENLYPHESPYRPIYWHQNERRIRQVYEIANDYYAVSMAGNSSSLYETGLYNTIASAAYYKLGIQNPYSWKNKSSFLIERKKL